MNHLEIKHLRMLCAIAKTGNMTRSAQTLCISQSALSQQLKDIETKLQVDLFFRTRKKMILSPIGRKLLAMAERVTAEMDNAELEIAKMVNGDHGELKVGTQCLFCYKWLPRVMRVFQDKFPNITFEIGTVNDLPRNLVSGKFDCIITAARTGDDTFDYLPLFEDQMICIMPVHHPLNARSWIRFEDFNSFPFLSHSEKESNRFYQFVLKPMGVEPEKFMTVGQPQAIIEMVAAGFGISIFPRWAIQNAFSTEDIIFRPITKNGMPITWQAAFLKNKQRPIFQMEFINLVQKMAIDEPPLGHLKKSELGANNQFKAVQN